MIAAHQEEQATHPGTFAGQVDLVYQNALPSTVAILIAGILCWIGFYDVLPEHIIHTWGSYLVLVAAFRYWLFLQYRREPKARTSKNWAKLMLVSAGMAGAGWAGVAIFPLFIQDGTYQLIASMVVLGIIAATVPVHSALPPAFAAACLPPSITLLYSITQVYDAGATFLLIATGIYFGLVFFTAKNTHRTLTRTLELQQEKEHLVDDLNLEAEKRQVANEALEESRNNLEKLVATRTKALSDKTKELDDYFSNAVDLFCIADTDGNFRKLNRAWEATLGYSVKELEGRSFLDLVHPDDRESTLAAISTLGSQEPVLNFVNRYRARDGSYRWIEWQSKPEGKTILAAARDITERKKSEELNQKTAEVLKLIATGQPASQVYDEIALMYEARHPGMRCSMLELENGVLLHGGAPSLPAEYCEAVHGLNNGPDVGSCGTSTYTGQRVLVEDIATDPKWAAIKDAALPHGLRCCWSEPIKDSAGEVLGAFGMYYNHPALPNADELDDLESAAQLASIVMERDQSQKRIRKLAFYDELTGLASRAHFFQHLEELIKTSKRTDRAFSLLYLDLDDFKDINDSLGHDAGDVLLRDVAARLSNVSRGSDFVARLGGDEFCVVVEDTEEDLDVAHVAHRCLEVMKKPIGLSTRKIALGCSIGIAVFPNDGNDVPGLLKAADASLYAAKESGKNKYAFFEPEFTKKAEYRFRIEHNLRDALEASQLSLSYQPQVHLATGQIVGMEALARWHNPQMGDVPPSRFIPVAERIGEIKPLTEWALRTACEQAVRWRRSFNRPLRVAVNVSPLLFLDSDLINLVKDVVNQSEIDPSDLQLEVTESVVQTDPANLATFTELKRLGVNLAIDDFGAGYSSFKSLKHLAVDCLKIDRYFINDMLLDHDSEMLVRSMIEIGHRLGHEIVAEGVEQQEQADALMALGCETVQGFLFSQPLVVDAATDLLTNSGSIVLPAAARL